MILRKWFTQKQLKDFQIILLILKDKYIVNIEKDIDKDKLIEKIKNDLLVKKYLTNQIIKKDIYIKNKLINLII